MSVVALHRHCRSSVVRLIFLHNIAHYFAKIEKYCTFAAETSNTPAMKPNLFITLLMSLAATQTQAEGMAVTDGFDIQKTTYYPYGEPTVEPKGQRYLFGGKEREHAGGRNSYDFGARNLTPYGTWSSPDPMATKFYNLNPYSYCAGDPINNIDYNGCDTLGISKQGIIQLKTVTDDAFDILQAEDGSSIQVDKSFYQSKLSKKVIGEDGNEYDCDFYNLANESESLFSFIVLNSDVEWSRLVYNKGTTAIGNSHNRYVDASGDSYWKSHFEEQSNLVLYDHSHPYISHPSPNDLENAERYRAKSPELVSRIYMKTNGRIKIIPYDKTYDRNVPLECDEVIVKPRY